jgi:hypothetical protein
MPFFSNAVSNDAEAGERGCHITTVAALGLHSRTLAQATVFATAAVCTMARPGTTARSSRVDGAVACGVGSASFEPRLGTGTDKLSAFGHPSLLTRLRKP